MATAGENGVLAEILGEVRALANDLRGMSERMAHVESKLDGRWATVSDHEARLRVLEASRSSVVTNEDLAAIEQKRADVVESALADAARKANIRMAVIVTAVTVVNTAIAAAQVLRP